MLVICGVRQKEGGEDFESCWCFRLNVRWLAGWLVLSLSGSLFSPRTLCCRRLCGQLRLARFFCHQMCLFF